MKHTLCTIPSCRNYKRYCRQHISGVVKNPTPIAKESEKRAEVNRKEYGPKARAFVAANPVCQVKSEVCTGKAQCVHHMIGKASTEDLLNEKYWMSVCWACNGFIEANDAFSRQQGWKLSKFSPENKRA